MRFSIKKQSRYRDLLCLESRHCYLEAVSLLHGGASGSTSGNGNAGNGGILLGVVVLQTVLQVLVMETDIAAV